MSSVIICGSMLPDRFADTPLLGDPNIALALHTSTQLEITAMDIQL